jgi:hypothetical protein
MSNLKNPLQWVSNLALLHQNRMATYFLLQKPTKRLRQLLLGYDLVLQLSLQDFETAVGYLLPTSFCVTKYHARR